MIFMADSRFRLLWRVMFWGLVLVMFVWELRWVGTLVFEFGAPLDVVEWAQAIFLQGYAAGVLFIGMNWLLVHFCRWLALRTASIIWQQVQVKPVMTFDVPIPTGDAVAHSEAGWTGTNTDARNQWVSISSAQARLAGPRSREIPLLGVSSGPAGDAL
jgi:hypothetical protein